MLERDGGHRGSQPEGYIHTATFAPIACLTYRATIDPRGRRKDDVWDGLFDNEEADDSYPHEQLEVLHSRERVIEVVQELPPLLILG